MNATVESLPKTGHWAFGRMLSSPLQTLESLQMQPRWVLPVLCASTFAAIVQYYLVDRVGLERLIAAVARSNEAIDPDAVLQQAVANKTQILLVQGISSFLGVVVTCLLVALLLWLLVLILGAEATYRQILSVVAHVWFLTTILQQSMLAMAVTARDNMDGFDMTNPLATNLGHFYRPDSTALLRILSSLDVITVATLALLVFGLRHVSDRLSWKAAAGIVLVPWTLYVVLQAWRPWGV